ncbi:MAG: hypothetical protein HQL22_04645 [Candidatus Omnitrophica bacterium]|nr:hypothetical protein [Candidatus Omnitrophota bacterium]
MKPSIFKKLIMVCLCCSFIGVGAAKAQSTLEYAVLTSITAALASASSPVVQAAHFKYKIEAIDAQTNGTVNAGTRQIILAVRITNDAPKYYQKITLSTSNISMRNITGEKIDVTNPNSKTPTGMPAVIELNNVLPFSSTYVVLTPKPILFSGMNIFKSDILVHVDLVAGLTTFTNPAHTAVDGVFASAVEEIIYEPSGVAITVAPIIPGKPVAAI